MGNEISIIFDKQWTNKHIKAHKKQLAKCERMEAALKATIAKLQADIDAERELEYDLLRTRNAAESNFERRWGEDAWRKLVKSV